MRMPRGRFTIRRLMIAVVVVAIVILLGAKSRERHRRLYGLALARHVEAINYFKHDDSLFKSGEVSLDQLRPSLLALMEAERDIWGGKVAAANHLARLKLSWISRMSP
jgi:hypothetical protein